MTNTRKRGREVIYAVRNVEGDATKRPNVVVRRTAAKDISFDITATGRTVAEAGAKAREEFQVMLAWAAKVKEAEEMVAKSKEDAKLTEQLATAIPKIRERVLPKP